MTKEVTYRQRILLADAIAQGPANGNSPAAGGTTYNQQPAPKSAIDCNELQSRGFYNRHLRESPTPSNSDSSVLRREPENLSAWCLRVKVELHVVADGDHSMSSIGRPRVDSVLQA
jgi:hypothetical protein